MRFLRFFWSGPGLLLVFVGGILFVGYVIHQGQEKQNATQNKNQVTRPLGQVNPTSSVDASVAHQEVELQNHKLSPVRVEPDPVKTQPVFNKAPQQRSLPTLVSFYSQVAATPTPTPKPKAEPEQLWLPPSIFIPCVLVNTVNSSHINTPVVGEILTDIYQNEKLVIAAGTLVSSFASNGSVRDRIEVSGNWLLVFHDGRQLKISGIACTRQANPENQQFGPEDCSAGILGTIVESDHYKIFTGTIGVLTTAILQAGTAAAGSAVSHGLTGVSLPDVAPVWAPYLNKMVNGESGDSRYVHVPAGTEFCIFPCETTHPLNRSIDNSATNQEQAQPERNDPISQATRMEREIMRSSQQPQPDEQREPKFKY